MNPREVNTHPERSQTSDIKDNQGLTNIIRDIKAFELKKQPSPEADELKDIKTDLQRIRENVSTEDPTRERTLGDWSKLMRESQVLHDKSSRVTSEGDQIYKDTQAMKDLIQGHFFQASKKTYQEIYRIERTPEWDMKEHERALIKRYVPNKKEVEDFYQLNTYVRGEQTKTGQDKKTDVNYYNPESRTFLAFSNSRTEEAQNLKPLHANESEKETYQRTLPHSEMMHYAQMEAIDEYNQEHADKISESEKVPDMTFIRHSLANKEYRAIAPYLNIDKTEPTYYNRGEEQFEKLMSEVPNFKAIEHLISQRHPHLEVTKITILPYYVNSAIVNARTRKSQ